ARQPDRDPGAARRGAGDRRRADARGAGPGDPDGPWHLTIQVGSGPLAPLQFGDPDILCAERVTQTRLPGPRRTGSAAIEIECGVAPFGKGVAGQVRLAEHDDPGDTSGP